LDLLSALARLWARKFLVLIALLLAAAVAIASRYTVSSSGLTLKQSVSAQSRTQFLVDTRYSSLARLALPAVASTVSARAPLFADYAASLPLKKKIAAKAGVSPSKLSIIANTTETAPATGAVQSTSYNSAPDQPTVPNDVVLTATDLLPLVTVSAKSTSARQAAALVNATVVELQGSVSALAKSQHVSGPTRMVLRSLGPAIGITRRDVFSLAKSIAYGLIVLMLLLLLILGFDRIRSASHRPPEVVVGS
jgi:hypothetical protein